MTKATAARQISESHPNDFWDLLPVELRQITDLQTAIPRIAKDKALLKRIQSTIQKVFTRHVLVRGDARKMSNEVVSSAHLIVTSPPYWTLKTYHDTLGQLGHISSYNNFITELDHVWRRCFELLVPGGRLVIVVGDVCLSRKKNEGRHTVVPLHATIQEHCRELGFDNLAPIIWYKIANAAYEVDREAGGFLGKPYEPNAVIKNDVEFILMQRKPGGYRTPGAAERILSVIPAEDQRRWFQQIWTGLGGASTKFHPAPYPLELAERLVRMFSFVGDTVLDPFMGTGTTTLAASKWGRNSISFEIDREYFRYATDRLQRELSTLFSNPLLLVDQG